MHELEVKAKCKISLLQLIRIITRSHKTAAAFVIRLGVKGGRALQSANRLSEKLYTHKLKKKFSFPLSSTTKTQRKTR